MKNLMRPWTCTPLTIQYDLYIMCDNICANCLHLFFHCRCMRAKRISKVHLIEKKFAVASYCEWWRLHRQPSLIERLPHCEVTLFFFFHTGVWVILSCSVSYCVIACVAQLPSSAVQVWWMWDRQGADCCCAPTPKGGMRVKVSPRWSLGGGCVWDDGGF